MATQLLKRPGAPSRVAERLRRLARAQVRLDGLQAELDEQLDAVRRRYHHRIGSLRDRTSHLLADLEAYCRGEREAILPAGRKSLATPFGEVGFRKVEPAVRLHDGLTDGDACRLLRDAEIGDLVRVRETPDKPAVRKALREGRITADQLYACGLQLLAGPERFYCKLRQDACDRASGVRRSRR